MDDNQSNVILACLKVILCVLSYEENESISNLAEVNTTSKVCILYFATYYSNEVCQIVYRKHHFSRRVCIQLPYSVANRKLTVAFFRVGTGSTVLNPPILFPLRRISK